jgi:hypothetical protein
VKAALSLVVLLVPLLDYQTVLAVVATVVCYYDTNTSGLFTFVTTSFCSVRLVVVCSFACMASSMLCVLACVWFVLG